MPLAGVTQPPMANGEIIFEAPWQGRAFGMARALCEQGLYDWDEFRERLISRLDGVESEGFQYFDHFLGALAQLLEDKGVCSSSELEARFREYEARPHGHDH